MLPASKAEVIKVEQGFADLKTHVTTEINALKHVNTEIIGVGAGSERCGGGAAQRRAPGRSTCAGLGAGAAKASPA